MTQSVNDILNGNIADLQAQNILLTEDYINLGLEIEDVELVLSGLTTSQYGASASISYNNSVIATLQGFIQ
jgi:hypothetical protein